MKSLLKNNFYKQIKTVLSQSYLLLIFAMMFFCSQDSYGQWSGGNLTYIQGGLGGPEIEGNNAWLELTGTNNSNSVMGLKFSNNSGAGQTTEAYLHYNLGTNKIHFSPDGVTGNSVFNVDADNGNTEIGGALDIVGGNIALFVDGDEAIWYDGTAFSWGFSGTWNRFADPITIGGSVVPPTNTALVTTNGEEIKMVGDNSYIHWHTAANSNVNGPTSGFVGCNQIGATFLESNLAGLNLDGETVINFLVSDNTRMTLDGSGNLGIGTNVPAYRLQVAGNADITGELTAASDKRLKENIQSLDDALSAVAKLNPVSYDFRVEDYPNMELPERQKMGFIAQDLERDFPTLVSTGALISDVDGNSFECKSVNYVELIPVLTKAIQEQQDIINSQGQELADLKEEMASIKSMLSASVKKSKSASIGQE